MTALYYTLAALFVTANSVPFIGPVVVPSLNFGYEIWRRDGNQRLVYLRNVLYSLEMEDDQPEADEEEDKSGQSRLLRQSNGVKIRADLMYRPGQN